MAVRPWLERKFPKFLPESELVEIIERLKGTPMRIHDKVLDLSEDILVQKIDSKWSIKEHIGHLYDLEELWIGRFHDFEQGEETLCAWDTANTKTSQANHNNQQVEYLIGQFDLARIQLLFSIHSLTRSKIVKTALHPRLLNPMNPVDLAFFIAEHDDHHLAHIDAIIALAD